MHLSISTVRLSNILLHYYILLLRSGWTSSCIHVIGKDILKFHAIYWPAFLSALNLPLPERYALWTIDGTEWFVDGEKIHLYFAHAIIYSTYLFKYMSIRSSPRNLYLWRFCDFGQDLMDILIVHWTIDLAFFGHMLHILTGVYILHFYGADAWG